jgi:O-antigen/teichoic acid export membrane protein
MQISYTKNYLQIYLWQGISLVLNFLSMFIVLPYLTSNPSIFGIYSICISVSIFLSYADFGFVSAGQKYATEHFARNEKEQEIKVTGFTSFILLFFLLLLSLLFFYLSFHPQLLIKNIHITSNSIVATNLLRIMALFTTLPFFQRILQIIFANRMEDYILQRVNILTSIIRIISVLFFFNNGNYNIVSYYLFSQILSFISIIISIFIAKKRYNYDFKLLLKSIKYDKIEFVKTKKLAFSGMYITIIWILYYELDPNVIGKFIGSKEVAIYAVGLSLLSFFRGILGILFSPFNIRFNHFIGVNDITGLKKFCNNVILILAPVVVLPIITIALIAKPLILSWVGINYLESVQIAKFLVLCNLFAFISYPGSMLLRALEKVHALNVISTILVLFYWVGILFTYKFLGLNSFAIFKFILFSIYFVVYFFILIKFMEINYIVFFFDIFKTIAIPIISLFIMYFFIKNYLPLEKSKINLLKVTFTGGIMISISLILSFFSSLKIRNYVFSNFSFLKNNKF